MAKKGQRPSRHLRIVRVKKGRKKILINPEVSKRLSKIPRKKGEILCEDIGGNKLFCDPDFPRGIQALNCVENDKGQVVCTPIKKNRGSLALPNFGAVIVTFEESGKVKRKKFLELPDIEIEGERIQPFVDVFPQSTPTIPEHKIGFEEFKGPPTKGLPGSLIRLTKTVGDSEKTRVDVLDISKKEMGQGDLSGFKVEMKKMDDNIIKMLKLKRERKFRL